MHMMRSDGSMQFCGLFRLRKWPPAAAAALVRPIPILLGMRSYLRQSATKPSYTILRSLIFSSSRILCSHLGWIWATMKMYEINGGVIPLTNER